MAWLIRMTRKTYFRRKINWLERDREQKNIEIAIWSVAIISESIASNLTGGAIFLAGTVYLWSARIRICTYPCLHVSVSARIRECTYPCLHVSMSARIRVCTTTISD
jgi:hypothetical protein